MFLVLSVCVRFLRRIIHSSFVFALKNWHMSEMNTTMFGFGYIHINSVAKKIMLLLLLLILYHICLAIRMRALIKFYKFNQQQWEQQRQRQRIAEWQKSIIVSLYYVEFVRMAGLSIHIIFGWNWWVASAAKIGKRKRRRKTINRDNIHSHILYYIHTMPVTPA